MKPGAIKSQTMKDRRKQEPELNDWEFKSVSRPLLAASMMVYAATNFAPLVQSGSASESASEPVVDR